MVDFYDYKRSSYFVENRIFKQFVEKIPKEYKFRVEWLFTCENDCNLLHYLNNNERLKNINKNEIKYLEFEYLDRGIHNFKQFGDTMSELFPNLEYLQIKQNYSYEDCFDDHMNETDEENSNINVSKDFLYFLNKLKLKKIKFVDNQSMFPLYLTNDLLFEIMPEKSTYLFTFERFTHHKEDINNATKGTKNIFTYGDYDDYDDYIF
jgi:hypothetical protein